MRGFTAGGEDQILEPEYLYPPEVSEVLERRCLVEPGLDDDPPSRWRRRVRSEPYCPLYSRPYLWSNHMTATDTAIEAADRAELEMYRPELIRGGVEEAKRKRHSMELAKRIKACSAVSAPPGHRPVANRYSRYHEDRMLYWELFWSINPKQD